jgi:hypothetical protein
MINVKVVGEGGLVSSRWRTIFVIIWLMAAWVLNLIARASMEKDTQNSILCPGVYVEI